MQDVSFKENLVAQKKTKRLNGGLPSRGMYSIKFVKQTNDRVLSHLYVTSLAPSQS